LAQLRGGENNPLSARSRSSQIKRPVRIGVGLLPYIAIASVWRRRRPVFTNLAASRHVSDINSPSRKLRLGRALKHGWPFCFGHTNTLQKPSINMSVEIDPKNYSV
jgi:hypothetical protein